MSDNTIRVQVFDVPEVTNCFSGGWGPSWSPEEITAIVRAEVERRFGDSATVEYFNVQDPVNQETFTDTIVEIQNRGLLYPVTAIDGMPVYDGAVSYPAILRAVNNKLLEREEATKA